MDLQAQGLPGGGVPGALCAPVTSALESGVSSGAGLSQRHIPADRGSSRLEKSWPGLLRTLAWLQPLIVSKSQLACGTVWCATLPPALLWVVTPDRGVGQRSDGV